MYGFALNRIALNGAISSALVLATASLSCAASVTAIAVRQADALAATASTGGLVATAQVTRHVIADILCEGNLYPQATHTQAAFASLSAKADIRAYVYRAATASATFYCESSIVAIAAGVLANANLACSAQISATANRVQVARAASYGDGDLWVESTAFRMALGHVSLPCAEVRVEPSIWQVASPFTRRDSYSDVSGAAEVYAAGVITMLPVTAASCTAGVSAVATVQQPAVAYTAGIAALFLADVFVASGGSAGIGCAAQLTVDGVRNVVPVVLPVQGAAQVTARMLQSHFSAASLSGKADVQSSSVVTRYASAPMQAASQFTATAVCNKISSAHVGCSVGVLANSLRSVFAQGSITGMCANVQAQAMQTTRHGTAVVSADSQAVVDAVVFRMVEARASGLAAVSAAPVRFINPTIGLHVLADVRATGFIDTPLNAALEGEAGIDVSAQRFLAGDAGIDAAAGVVADAARFVLADAVLFAQSDVDAAGVAHRVAGAELAGGAEFNALAFRGLAMVAQVIACTAEVHADTIANADSIDPDERSFRSPARVSHFSRLFIDTDFRRPA